MTDYWADFEISFRRGDLYILVVKVTDDAGVVQNLSGWLEFWFTARYRPEESTAVLALTKTGGAITLVNSGVSGDAKIEIPTSATSGLTNRVHRLFADLQGKDAAGKIHTLAAGRVIVLPETTTAS